MKVKGANQNGKELMSQDECPRGDQGGRKACPHHVSNLLCCALHTVGAEHLLKCKIIHCGTSVQATYTLKKLHIFPRLSSPSLITEIVTSGSWGR